MAKIILSPIGCFIYLTPDPYLEFDIESIFVDALG